MGVLAPLMRSYRRTYPRRFRTAFQDFVMRKLSSISAIMAANLFIGIAKLSVEPGTYGLAETSNIPSTALGRVAAFSRYGYCTIEPQPAQNGQKTPFKPASPKFASVKSPDRTSGSAKKMATAGRSPSPSLSHLLKTMNGAGAVNAGERSTYSFTS